MIVVQVPPALAVGVGGFFFESFTLIYHFSPLPRSLWLVSCFRLNGPVRQYFSLYRVISQREGERDR